MKQLDYNDEMHDTTANNNNNSSICSVNLQCDYIFTIAAANNYGRAIIIEYNFLCITVL